MSGAEGFWKVIKDEFPGTVKLDDFVKFMKEALEERGFNGENCIASVSTCRDENTRPLHRAIQDNFGYAFNFVALSGMLFAGKSSMLAAMHHSPDETGKEHYLFVAMPHVAISPEGEQGICHRPHRKGTSKACGALSNFLGEIHSGHVSLELEKLDMEYSLMKQRLLSIMKYGEQPSLIGLTKIALRAIEEDIDAMIKQILPDPQNSDYAVITGIQIHGPHEDTYIYMNRFYGYKDRKEFQVPLNK